MQAVGETEASSGFGPVLRDERRDAVPILRPDPQELDASAVPFGLVAHHALTADFLLPVARQPESEEQHASDGDAGVSFNECTSAPKHGE